MALVQTASSFRVNHGTLGAWNVGAATVAMWVRVVNLPASSGWPNSRYLFAKNSNSGPIFPAFYCRVDSVGNVQFDRSSYSGGSYPWATYRTNTTPLASTGVDKFVAITLANSGTGRGVIYVGDRTTPAATQTLSTNTDIGGTPDDLSGLDFMVGNSAALTLALDCVFSDVLVTDTVLTQAEIQAWQYSLMRPASGVKLFTEYGLHGTGSQNDWSGNSYSGTVTNGSVAAHVPLIHGWQVPRMDVAQAVVAAAGQPIVKRWGGVPFMRQGGATFGQGWM